MKDPNLRRCSRAARGMWIDMLCIMFECEDRGVFSTGGSPWTNEDIAAAVGGDIAEGLACIDELLRKGVAHRNQAGAILCKRMVRDEQIRQERVKAGSNGGSKTQANRQAKLKQTDKQKQSSSSSSSNSPNGGAPKAPISIWDYGVSVLTREGQDATKMRNVIAKTLHEYDERSVLNALRDTEKTARADSKSYFLGCLKGARKKGAAPEMVV